MGTELRHHLGIVRGLLVAQRVRQHRVLRGQAFPRVLLLADQLGERGRFRRRSRRGGVECRLHAAPADDLCHPKRLTDEVQPLFERRPTDVGEQPNVCGDQSVEASVDGRPRRRFFIDIVWASEDRQRSPELIERRCMLALRDERPRQTRSRYGRLHVPVPKSCPAPLERRGRDGDGLSRVAGPHEDGRVVWVAVERTLAEGRFSS